LALKGQGWEDQGAWVSPASSRSVKSLSLLSEAKEVSVGEMPVVYQELKKLEVFQRIPVQTPAFSMNFSKTFLTSSSYDM